ncbi:MAG TPA: alpha/beta hydrolase [Gemmatimonadaceae bacterium]|nr:alpha/beta hydrolase [Gemmatimonadaceae bacterium]
MNISALRNHVHRYVPPKNGDTRTLLVLHGTGGNENDLLPLAQLLAPDAGVLSPRGRVLEHGAPRFFRRLAEGVFDLDDLRLRTENLVAFVEAAASKYEFDASNVIAVGLSNGANIASSVLLSSPATLASAVLFRPMVPFEPKDPVPLAAKRVFISAGEQDPMVSPAHPEHLAELLRVCGADVTLVWQPGGHGLTRADIDAAHAWLRAGLPA